MGRVHTSEDALEHRYRYGSQILCGGLVLVIFTLSEVSAMGSGTNRKPCQAKRSTATVSTVRQVYENLCREVLPKSKWSVHVSSVEGKRELLSSRTLRA